MQRQSLQKKTHGWNEINQIKHGLKKPDQLVMTIHGAVSAAILKHNMHGKNKNLDRWRTSVRETFEGMFSKFKKRARYRGHTNVQLQFFMDAIVQNVKHLVAIHSPPLFQGAQRLFRWNYA
tara:strand:+ start:269 stop:631 length:363 start_codon:yes stop_codon:yes gene_type:complete